VALGPGRRPPERHLDPVTDYAQRRVFALRTAPDLYLADGDQTPDDYAEFLFRTSSVMLHEPTATGRAHGPPVG
jgi:hypothetical protein